jgi:cytochrome c553
VLDKQRSPGMKSRLDHFRPLRRLTMPHASIRGAAVLALALSCAAAWAEDDPLAGRELFEDTLNASGLQNLTGPCISCHQTVQNRRTKIGGSAWADISFDTAMTRFQQAVQNQPPMNQFAQLTGQQARDIAAYIADTPKTVPGSDGQLDFIASAVNTMTAAQNVDLHHAVATTESLTVVSIDIVGTGAARFSRTMQCDHVVIAPAQSCTLAATFSPLDTTPVAPTLRFTLRQGTSATTFERTVKLSGTVASPTPTPAPASDSGGGALGLPGLLALAAACGLLTRRRP